MRTTAITNSQLFALMGGLLAPQVLVLILWSAINPFGIILQLNVNQRVNFQVCYSPTDVIFGSISFAYIGLLLVVGAVLSFKTRRLPDIFKESQYIALSTYNTLFVAVVCVALGIILGCVAVCFWPHLWRRSGWLTHTSYFGECHTQV
jgi:hypothetical protein